MTVVGDDKHLNRTNNKYPGDKYRKIDQVPEQGQGQGAGDTNQRGPHGDALIKNAEPDKKTYFFSAQGKGS